MNRMTVTAMVLGLMAAAACKKNNDSTANQPAKTPLKP